MLWRTPDPKRAYDVVIVGGGGHGLATAYYLAKNHGITDVAVLERGWLAGGNMARNTTIIRSNYLWDESAAIYEHSLKLWEGLTDELDYDVLFSQRGVLNLAHNLHDVREGAAARPRQPAERRRRGVARRRRRSRSSVRSSTSSTDVRYPILGATLQRRGGIARHDAVAWALARAADRLGVDLIQNCEVTGIDVAAGGSSACGRRAGHRRAEGRCCARPATRRCWRRWSGLRLPIQTPSAAGARVGAARAGAPTASSCPTPCTCTSARRTRASW